jgi:hypothetical protein
MPPDVFLVLASSGLTLVASLMFFVSDDPPPPERIVEPKDEVTFCLPPKRMRPPPLPRRHTPLNIMITTVQGQLTLRPQGDEWLMTLDAVPLADSPAVQVHGEDGGGAVHDLRWHGKAGLVRPLRQQWKQKPGRA